MSQEWPCPDSVILMSLEDEVLELGDLEAGWTIADGEMGCGSQRERVAEWMDTGETLLLSPKHGACVFTIGHMEFQIRNSLKDMLDCALPSNILHSLTKQQLL